jgi:hypothetical protein
MAEPRPTASLGGDGQIADPVIMPGLARAHASQNPSTVAPSVVPQDVRALRAIAHAAGTILAGSDDGGRLLSFA